MFRRVGKARKQKAIESQKEDIITKPSTLIPLDMTIEILSRLPAKSVGRFRCVSKLWSSMTTTRCFAKSFAIHSSSRRFLLSVTKEEDNKRVFLSLPHHQQEDPENDHHTRLESYEMIGPKEDVHRAYYTDKFRGDFDVRHSIHGLVSFENSQSIIIWNPTLRQHITLPQPQITKPLTSLLGYDPISGEHKVLCMSLCEDARKNGEDTQIFTLGVGGSWRKITKSNNHPIHIIMRSWRCIDGVLYYYGVDYSVVSFDVRSEKFPVIKKPDWGKFSAKIYVPCPGHSLISYKGRLASFYDGCPMKILWVLEDIKKQEWSSREIELHVGSLLLLNGDTGDDELIFTYMSGGYSPCGFPLFYYDLKTEITRRVTYQGQGIKNCWFRFVSFPNHIESLVCLKSLLLNQQA